MLGRLTHQGKTLPNPLVLQALSPASFEKVHEPGYPHDHDETFLPTWDEDTTGSRNQALWFQAPEGWGLLVTAS